MTQQEDHKSTSPNEFFALPDELDYITTDKSLDLPRKGPSEIWGNSLFRGLPLAHGYPAPMYPGHLMKGGMAQGSKRSHSACYLLSFFNRSEYV